MPISARTRISAAGFGVLLVVSACSWFNGDDANPTTPPPATVESVTVTSQSETTTEQDQAGTTSTTGEDTATTTEQQAQQSALGGEGKDRPSGANAFLSTGGLAISGLQRCAALMPGPRSTGGVFQIPDYVWAQVLLGDLFYADVSEGKSVIRDILDLRDVDISSLRQSPTTVTGTTLATLAPSATLPTDQVRLNPNVLPQLTATLVPITPLLTLATIPLRVITLPPNLTLPTLVTLPPATTTLPRLLQTEITNEAELLEDAKLCGTGWDPDDILELMVTGPAGVVVHEDFPVTDSDGDFGSIWRPSPEHSLGEYTVTVTDGTNVSTDIVRVLPATAQRIHVLGENQGPAGTVFRIGIAGASPNDSIDLHAYVFGASDEGFAVWEYVGTVTGIATSDIGTAVHDFASLPDDPPGSYCFIGSGMTYGLMSGCSNAGIEILP